MTCCPVQTRARPFAGGIAHAAVAGLGPACAERAILAAFDTLTRLERMLDRTDETSALMRLVAAPVGQPVQVPLWLWHMLQLANEISWRTDGLFDVAAAGTEGVARWTDIDLSTRGFVRLCRPLVPDLGGLVKGFAADLGARALHEMGARSGLMDIGGRVRVFGPNEWRIHFQRQDQRGQQQCVPVPVTDGAVAALGRFSRAGLMDPEQNLRLSAMEVGAANILVRAASAGAADALTKVVALRPKLSRALLAPFGATPVHLAPEGTSRITYAS